MPDVAPIGPGDPGSVDGYEIAGRLGEAVYLGRPPGGDRVVVRLLPADLDPGRFLAATGPLREISAFCTAEILDTGVADGRPYIVSEYIDGPSLKEAVASSGTLRGPALHRLAVGMMTALVAVHQAGMTHGDIRPDNVVLGPDGPRVINFGVARALSSTDAADTRSVGVPAFTAPELLRGEAPAPAADLFGWAATLAFAATGRSPFDGGSMAGTVNRILNDDPDLEAVEDDLRGVVAACLSKDPHARPTASDVLLKLVGELLTTDLGPPPAAPRPVRRGRPLLLGAGAVAVALLSGSAVYLLTSPSAASAPAAAGTPSPAGELLPAATPGATGPEIVLSPLEEVEKASKDIVLPEVGITLHEHPKDPVRLSGYMWVKEPFNTYVRERGKDSYRQVDNLTSPALSPDEELVALSPGLKFTQSDTDYLKITKVSTGESFTVPTVKKPFESAFPVWSKDGSKVLLTVIQKDKPVSGGFVIVDVAAKKSTLVVTEVVGSSTAPFTFAPDGTVARRFFDGKTPGADFYNLQGQIVRTMRWVGTPRGTDWFSPSGRLFTTICPKEKGICVWDTVTGNRRHTVPDDGVTELIGWFNENHLLVVKNVGKNRQAQVIDFVGGTHRVLADIKGRVDEKAKGKDIAAVLSFTRRSAP
ncbi:serine/threonine protein kinase [Planobispora rosea]|uniref:serine/threonine protein kinase n=1 Tax=Planobispora rosea TaxID=35762 RepID=UPI00083ACF1B|nr:serine/threonine-protein kinase [Planobispora rosea]